MPLFFGVAAFLLAVAAIIIGVEAIRRINSQNEEFLKAYVQGIQADLQSKDAQLEALRKEIVAMRRNRAVNSQALADLEKRNAMKKEKSKDPAADSPYNRFIPSAIGTKKRIVA